MSPPPSPRAIGLLDLEAERDQLGAELEDAVLRVLRSGRYVLGPEVEALESAFATLCRVPHAVGVSSGTEALVLALKALGVEPGDHVVTSPFTFFASAGAIAWIGAVPRLADVELETGLLDPAAAESALDARTSALLPVHLYGQLADVRALRALADARGLRLLEDAAQSHGATRDGLACGELGDAAAFSFYPTKNLGAAGEAGLVVTRDGGTAQRLRLLRDHGMAQKYVHSSLGTNARMHAFQGAVLRVKLPHLAAWNGRRRRWAALYDELFGGCEELRPSAVAPGSQPVFHQYAVRILGGQAPARRDAVLAGLAERGIQAGVHYPRPVHLQPAAAPWGYRAGDFPAAERLAGEVLCLPVHPFLEAADVERAARAVLELVRG